MTADHVVATHVVVWHVVATHVVVHARGLTYYTNKWRPSWEEEVMEEQIQCLLGLHYKLYYDISTCITVGHVIFTRDALQSTVQQLSTTEYCTGSTTELCTRTFHYRPLYNSISLESTVQQHFTTEHPSPCTRAVSVTTA